jgi:hypothetical protein
MSVSTEVQRTLVKSPPELWAELSDPEALMRHLGDFGALRITKAEPETKVEWETEGASGVVQLKPSGWGTKVTLSVTRDPPIPEESPEPDSAILAEAEPTPDPEPTMTIEATPGLEPAAGTESEPVASAEPQPEAVAILQSEPTPELEPVASAEPQPELPPVEPEPQIGFFARLFGKRKAKPVAVVEPKPEPRPEPEPEIEIEIVALAAPEPIYPDPPTEPAVDLAAELEAVEVQMATETTELLTGVLDRLGAAHHRPFSRG